MTQENIKKLISLIDKSDIKAGSLTIHFDKYGNPVKLEKKENFRI